MPRASKIKIGDKFGRLEVKARYPKPIVYEHPTNGFNKTIIWECLCECGNKHLARSNNLLSGNTRSCGCLNTEISSERRILNNRLIKAIEKKANTLQDYQMIAFQILNYIEREL